MLRADKNIEMLTKGGGSDKHPTIRVICTAPTLIGVRQEPSTIPRAWESHNSKHDVLAIILISIRYRAG